MSWLVGSMRLNSATGSVPHIAARKKRLPQHLPHGTGRDFLRRALVGAPPRAHRERGGGREGHAPDREKVVPATTPEQNQHNGDVEHGDGHRHRDQAYHRVDLLGTDAAQLALAETGGQAVLDLVAAEPVQERADQPVAGLGSLHGFVRPSHSKNLFTINGPGPT
ncbi:hypothetical protein ACVWZV_005829 [Bradyrhizobium sp. GM5.1]